MAMSVCCKDQDTVETQHAMPVYPRAHVFAAIVNSTVPTIHFSLR